MLGNDLLLWRGVAVNMVLRRMLEARGVSPAVLEWIFSIIPMFELGLLLAGCAAVVVAAQRADGVDVPPLRRWLREAVYVAIALVAARLLYWILLHPSHELVAMLVRWDYLVFCLFAGAVLARFPIAVRKWVLVALSVVFLAQYTDQYAFALILTACLTGFAALHWERTRRPRVAAVVHGTLVLGVFVAFWILRPIHGRAALFGWGLFSFVLFRHISFVVEALRGARAGLGSYLCYLLFYPSCIGAMEVYPEFSRNLRGAGDYDYRAAVVGIVRGSALMWLGLQITTTESIMLQSATTVLLWQNLLLVFFRGALFSMGLWSSIEGGALFYGFRLRPNFAGVLSAENPSQFWRAWRGTMTNWLIQYVYIPLGGNRRHRTLNILAAFVVSVVWHCAGIPFLHWETYRWWDFMSVVTWGGINFAGVATHAVVRRWRPPHHYPQPLETGSRALKRGLTFCFGSMTVALLGFSLANPERFGWFMCMIVGLGERCR